MPVTKRRTIRPGLLVGVVSLITVAPVSAQPSSPRDSVLAVVDAFFAAMVARDSAAIMRTMTPDAMTWAVASGTDRTPKARRLTDFGSTLARDTTVMRERIWSPTVLVHRETAVVWAPYDFHINGRFSHCGVDAFSLVRGEGRWQIAAISYTVERTGCAPSPLGPPK